MEPLEESEFEFYQETYGGVPFRLMPGYPTFEVGENISTAQEVYMIPASYLLQFVLESFPINFGEGDVFAATKRTMPGASYFMTKGLSIKPWNDRPCDPFGAYNAISRPGGRAAFTKYLLATITYETQAFGDDDGNEPDPNKPEEFLEHSVSSGGEFLLVPPRKVNMEKPEGTPLPPEEAAIAAAGQMPNIVIILPSFDHVFKWKAVKSPPWERITDRLGTVNDATFKPAFDATRETLLFSGISGSQKFTWNGKSVRASPWDLEFRMSQRCIKDADDGIVTWNKVYHPDLGWIKVTQGGDDPQPLYKTTDFTAMFTP